MAEQTSIFEMDALVDEDENGPRDCRHGDPHVRGRNCDGKGGWFDGDGEWVECKNCGGTGRERIPY